MRNQKALPVAFILISLLPACNSLSPHKSAGVDPNVPVSKSALPRVVQPYEQIEETLNCIAQTKALSTQTFVVGPFVDSTGKINAVAPGSTGSFLPQGGSATYITDAIRRAGGQVVSVYFGPPARPVAARYAINGIFNSLDFGKPLAADVRVAGIGPAASWGWAQLSLSIQLDLADSRLNRQMSMIQRPIRYSLMGAGVGRDFTGTLLTGQLAFQNQERLQLEALNGPIALGVADVLMREFPQAKQACGHLIEPLVSL